MFFRLFLNVAPPLLPYVGDSIQKKPLFALSHTEHLRADPRTEAAAAGASHQGEKHTKHFGRE